MLLASSLKKRLELRLEEVKAAGITIDSTAVNCIMNLPTEMHCAKEKGAPAQVALKWTLICCVAMQCFKFMLSPR